MADMRAKGRDRPTGVAGSGNHNAKLTEDGVRAIRDLRGVATSRTVAGQFGVSPSLVRDIWGGRGWAHVL